MRTLHVGEFDAVVTIFNAVRHLTKSDFEKAMRNIHRNLRRGGFYIFDIFNLDYFTHSDHITRLTIDWQKSVGNRTIRAIQYSTVDKNGILASYTTCYEKTGSKNPKISNSSQTLQIYSAVQLRKMLKNTGFKVLGHSTMDGSKFIETKSERILTIAKKA
jgi:SAM-dependent methyltransferase